MSMTQRGHTNLGGNRTVINPFMDNGIFGRITIEVDNSYNRGYIPPFSLWAPSDYGTSPKYMPYMPEINITTANSTTSLDIDNEWADYFKVGDEVMVLDVSTLASSNFAIRGQSGADVSSYTAGTDGCTVSAVGAKDSGGTGYVLITLTDALSAAATGGAKGTGDILFLCDDAAAAENKAYQRSKEIVII